LLPLAFLLVFNQGKVTFYHKRSGGWRLCTNFKQHTKTVHMKVLSIVFTVCAGLSSLSCNEHGADSNSAPKDGVRIIKNDLDIPWEITLDKSNRIWMTERDGKISCINPADGKTIMSYTIPDVESRGEGGLLGMALHPDFSNNGFLYVSYDYLDGGDYREKLVRYKYADNTLSQPFILISNIRAAGIHNGSRLWISNEGTPKIFMTTGDASDQSLPQQNNTVNGKVLRLNLDGSIPADNPFPGNPVWSFGHRNAQGLVVANNIMYASEHGPNEEDEVNIIEKARNYGWPNVEGPCNGNETSFCNTHNVKAPIWNSGGSTLAVCGLDYYNNNLLPAWKNSLLMLTLKNSSLVQLSLSADGKSITGSKTWFRNEWGRLRDLCVAPDGKVYICTSNGGNDKLIEISRL
jgi:aldose sugar dehydrogenase